MPPHPVFIFVALTALVGGGWLVVFNNLFAYDLFMCISVFACMYICVRVLDPLELELQTVVSCHVVAGN